MTRTFNYREDTSQHAARLASFERQMADFARGERLRELREHRHLSQEDAAHEIGVSVKTIRSWEKGAGIRWQNAKTAARFYSVDPETLVSREQSGGSPEVPAELPQMDRIEAQLVEVLDQQAELLATMAELHDGLARLQQRGERGKRGRTAKGS